MSCQSDPRKLETLTAGADTVYPGPPPNGHHSLPWVLRHSYITAVFTWLHSQHKLITSSATAPPPANQRQSHWSNSEQCPASWQLLEAVPC